MSALHVLIVAGPAEARRIGEPLGETGLALELEHHEDAASATVRLRAAVCDAILLAPPSVDAGLAAVRLLHAASPDSAIVVIAPRDDEEFRAAVLENGGTDCIAHDEVEARILRRVLRNAVSRKALECTTCRHEAQLRTLFDLNPHPMWVYDARTLRFLAVNQVAVRSYGYSEDEFLSMTIADIRSPAEVARLREHLAAGLQPRQPDGLWRHRYRNGEEIEVEVSAQAVPLWGPHARLVQARNVTAERRAIRAIETSERRFRDLFEHSAGYICIHDLAGVLLAINPAAAASLGYTAVELLGRSLSDLIGAKLRAECEAYLQRIAHHGEDEGLLRVRAGDGGERLWQYRNRVFVDVDGIARVMGHAQDITALRAAERGRELSERRLRTIADALPLMIAYVDAGQRIVFANTAYRRLRQRDGDIVGVHLRDVLGERRYRLRLPYLERALRGERVVFEYEEGEGDAARSVEATLIPQLGSTAEVVGVHAMLQDVTAKKREERRLLHLARLDALTGLLNRNGFQERLDNAIVRAHDQGSMLALLYLDVDRFKRVNDTHGHAVGDALLRAFAMRLSEKMRASDVVARLGGDEFTVLIEAMSGARHAERIAGKLVAAMRRPFELHGEALTVSVGVSIGLCLCRGGALSAKEMLVRADTMLYAAKQSGRGTFRMTAVPASAATEKAVLDSFERRLG
ncbi:diguanylate cyclase [Dokdonella sp.]|uniref:sensor domain-containing protein n=1 Tax=Dokdonella sp. TaxID=2291710 RepID=UPI001B19D0B1|nr:diguanylate cyclase [Dokdonella sp.]MBO9663374.1 diguanylate cyclase [Dokdonella sp.]